MTIWSLLSLVNGYQTDLVILLSTEFSIHEKGQIASPRC